MSQAQLAAAIVGYSPSFVAMVETSRRVPKPDFAERCDRVLETSGILSRLTDDLVCRGMPPEWLGKWLQIEGTATSLLSYEPLYPVYCRSSRTHGRSSPHPAGRSTSTIRLKRAWRASAS